MREPVQVALGLPDAADQRGDPVRQVFTAAF